MSERLNVMYGERTVCAFELLDRNGQYIEELRYELRLASQSGELSCPDCGARMVLCAGAIRQPYFRHMELGDCFVSVEFRTKAGKRRYACRELLFQMARDGGFSKVALEEQQDGLFPILFEADGQTSGYVYLDGKTRDYRELERTNTGYCRQGIRLYFFLNLKYRSQSLNLTSDEAECAVINGGIIYYLDEGARTITFRKKYQDTNRVAQYYEETQIIDSLSPDELRAFDRAFMEHYEAHVRKVRQQFSRVLRLPADEGIDDDYMAMDYVLMDALEEIWVLPAFLHRTEGHEQHQKNRIAFLETENEKMYGLPQLERNAYSDRLCRYVEKERNSWSWQ